MKGIAVFLGLLLICSSVNAISLNADTLPTCLTQAGCSLDILFTTLTGLSSTGLAGGDVVINSAQNAVINVLSDKQFATFTVAGNAIINVSQNVKMIVGTAASVGAKGSLFVYGQVQAGAASVDQTTTSTISGVLAIGASGKATFDNGVQLLVGSATSIGAGATLQIGNTASVAQGAISSATDAVVAVVGTTLTLAGTYVSSGQSYLSATKATVEVTAATTIGAIVVLTDNAQVQAKAAAAAALGLIVTGLGNTIEVATGAVFSIKGEATVTAGAALTTVRYILYEYRLHVEGNITFTRGNGTQTPTCNGEISGGLGSHFVVGADTAVLAKAAATINGTVVLLAGASYQAFAATTTIVQLVVAASGVVIAAASATVILIQQFTVVASSAFQVLGDVRYTIAQ